jgi:hypothetical protein
MSHASLLRSNLYSAFIGILPFHIPKSGDQIVTYPLEPAALPPPNGTYPEGEEAGRRRPAFVFDSVPRLYEPGCGPEEGRNRRTRNTAAFSKRSGVTLRFHRRQEAGFVQFQGNPNHRCFVTLRKYR